MLLSQINFPERIGFIQLFMFLTQKKSYIFSSARYINVLSLSGICVKISTRISSGTFGKFSYGTQIQYGC